MNAVLLMGIQASGKSAFFRERFADTHVRINLDMLRTRYREQRLIETCLEIAQPFVIDNTNVSQAERARYLPRLAEAAVPVTGYYFQSTIRDCLARNAARPDPARVPDRGVMGTHARLEVPNLSEGFVGLHYVRFDGAGGFVVEGWNP
jgi:predicted kinase